MGPGTGRTSLRPPQPPAPPATACTTCKPPPPPPRRRRGTGSAGAEGSAANGTATGKAHAWAGTNGADDSPNRVRALGGQASGTATHTRTMTSVEGEAQGGMLTMRGQTKGGGVAGEMDVMTAQGKVRIAENRAANGAVLGRSASAEGSAQMMRAKVTGTDAIGNQGSVEGKIFAAEAKGDYLLGNDGKRVGIALGGKAQAAAASVNMTAKRVIPIPFTNWSINMEGNVELSGGSVGGGAGAYAYKDLQDGRYKAGVMGKLAAIAGIEIDREISIGPRTPPGK